MCTETLLLQKENRDSSDIESQIDLKIYENTVQIRTLSKLRDTLLPKLISGEVRVNI